MLIQSIQSILKQKKIPIEAVLFPLYLFLAVIFFARGYRGELVDDGLAGLVKFENQGWQGFWQSFGFTSLYYFHDIFVLVVYMICGKSAMGWFIVMVTLHSFNACLSFSFFKKFYLLMGVERGMLIAFTGSVLFLLSPYQTENVLWAATLHYAVALTIFLLISIMLLNALQSGKLNGKITVVVGALYCVALMTLEISLIFPFAWLALGVGVILHKKTAIDLRLFITRFILPLGCLIALYFISTRIIKGHWLPHYGVEHLLNNNIQSYCTGHARYLLKLLGYIHFAKYPTRNLLYVFCERWKLMLVMEVFILAAIFTLLWMRRKKAEGITILLLAAMAFLLLLPSLHMFFMFLFNTENDRLSYFFSLALYQIIALVLITLFSYAGLFIIFVYGIAGLYFLNQQVGKWQFAGIKQDACIQSFIWTDAPKVYVLNEPTNFNGAYVFRNDERLVYALNLFKRYKHPERIEHVFSFCSTSTSDSTVVDIRNDSTLRVIAITGGWLMREAVGATSYKTSDFDATVDKWIPAYDVVFHHKQPGAVYIYVTSDGYKLLGNF